MQKIIAAALAASLVVGPAFAVEPAVQPVAPVAAAPLPIAPVPVNWTLPANTEVVVTPNSLVTSKSVREGDTFAVSTVYDVLLNNHIVIPRGTRGQGKVTWRTGKGAFGKSAKMEIAMEWLDVGGRRVALQGKHRQEGEGNTAATIGTVLAVGVFGAFVTGKSATIPNGMQLKAFTVEPIDVVAAATPLAPQPATLAPAPAGAALGTTPAT